MLGFDYSKRFAHGCLTAPWTITLPDAWSDFFDVANGTAVEPQDARSSLRRRVRVRGLLVVHQPIPSIKRAAEFVGAYTRDFSKNSIGLVTPMQCFPEETLRLVLPTMWLTMVVIRCQRHNKACWEVGTRLLYRHEPSLEAFDLSEIAAACD